MVRGPPFCFELVESLRERVPLRVCGNDGFTTSEMLRRFRMTGVASLFCSMTALLRIMGSAKNIRKRRVYSSTDTEIDRFIV